MEIKIFIMLKIIFAFLSSATSDDEDFFKDYCQEDLCKYQGGAGVHTGCKGGVLHNGKLQSPPCSDDAAIIPLTDSDKQFILDLHNEQRNFVACGGLYKRYRLGPGCRLGVVTWDKELEKTAFLHSSYCTFEHDKCRNTLKFPFSGQNLGILGYKKEPQSPAVYINVISYLWYLEHSYTTMDMINDFYQQTKVMVGHFLTLINERNNRIGCTLVTFYSNEKKSSSAMLSCNYPTTNLVKSTIYNSCKEPASKCDTGTDPKYKFLCSSKEEYDVSGKLKHIPYDGNGKEVFSKCGEKPEILHYAKEGGDVVRKQHKAAYPKIPMADEKAEGTPAKPPNTGNPSAGGIPDYSEDEYDSFDDGSVVPWQECSYIHICFILFILFNCLIQGD